MLDRFLKRIEANAEKPASGPVVIVALGDSVTQGCMELGRMDYDGVYHNVLKGMLEKRFPKTTFSVINAGVGGETAADGLKRLKRDALSHSPNLLLVAFCLNDACKGVQSLDEYSSDIREIISRAKNETEAEIIVLTPNFMASRKTSRIAHEHRQFANMMVDMQREGVLKTFSDTLKGIAEELDIPVADIFAKWSTLEEKGLDTTSFLSNGLNHPDRPRQRLAAKTIMDLIGKAAAETGKYGIS